MTDCFVVYSCREEEEKERQEMERKEFELIMRKEISRKGRTEREASARAARTPSNLRSPISCIMVRFLFLCGAFFPFLS